MIDVEMIDLPIYLGEGLRCECHVFVTRLPRLARKC